MVAALLAACDQPAAPTSVPDVSGSWSSPYVLAGCAFSGFCPPKTCFDAATANLFLNYRVELTVQQNRNHASGTVRLTSRSTSTGEVVSDRIAPYGGEVSEAGELSLRTRLEPQRGDRLYIFNWKSRVSGGSLDGTFTTRAVTERSDGEVCRVDTDWRVSR